MADEFNLNRLYWHSRRGMLELDLLLLPFVEHAFTDLSQEDKEDYIALLECEDQDLFTWLMQRNTPIDPNHARVINLILEFNRHSGQT